MRRRVIGRLASILAQAERDLEDGAGIPTVIELERLAAEVSRTMATMVGTMLGTDRPAYVRGHRAAVILVLIAETGASSTDARNAVRNILKMDNKGVQQ
jgi:hypothetical protein